MTPLFPGDALVDELPTLTDVYELEVGTPARGRKLPDPGARLRTGRLDAIDSVGRNAPGVIGAAFNNRLLLDGFAGEPDAAPGGLNPFGHPAQENVTRLLLDAHRMLEAQSAVLQQYATDRKLLRDAFPEEAAQADAAGDLDLLIPAVIGSSPGLDNRHRVRSILRTPAVTALRCEPTSDTTAVALPPLRYPPESILQTAGSALRARGNRHDQ